VAKSSVFQLKKKNHLFFPMWFGGAFVGGSDGCRVGVEVGAVG
jgi:hypothetical protein